MLNPFIKVNHAYWPISAMCHVLEVSESGYYHHWTRGTACHRIPDVALLTHIRAIHREVKGEYVVTTDSKHNLPIAPNLLQRNFTTMAPNQVWTGDITYIQTNEGWLVLDLFNQQVVGLVCKIICVLALWLTRYGWRGPDVT